MRPALLALAALTAVPAHAAERYLDDRSTPVSVVESLYNAINRKEYARAWSYFAEPPAKTPEEYAKGFAATESVTVRTGQASEEGAAGSTYYELPVAIEAKQDGGEPKTFAGCYRLRLANPQIQAEDFTPLHIVEGKLAPSTQPLEQAVPASCGDGPLPPATDLPLQQAGEMFRAAMGRTCESVAQADADEPKAESYELHFRYRSDADSDPQRTARLFRFPCNSGAYNESHVYVLAFDSGEMRLVGFAVPELDIRYVGDDKQGEVEAIYVTGFQASTELVNSQFDPGTMALTSTAKWRGAGDASSSGVWAFRNGDFALTKYDVDASYDGQVDPQSVVDYQTGP